MLVAGGACGVSGIKWGEKSAVPLASFFLGWGGGSAPAVSLAGEDAATPTLACLIKPGHGGTFSLIIQRRQS